jgi:hypothetical protein
MTMSEWEYLILDQRTERHGDGWVPVPFETWEFDHRGKMCWELVCTLSGDRVVFKRPKSTKPQATTGIVSVQSQGENVMGFTVDSAGNLLFGFSDDKNDLDVAPPTGDGTGLVVTLTSDNPATAAVGATTEGVDAAGNPQYSAPLTFGVDGSFNAGATVANQSGAPLVDNDGTTPFVQPATVNVPVAAGQAVTGEITTNAPS